MYHAAREPYIPEIPAGGAAPVASEESAKLQTIHELVRSGDYHVPASAIADRIIERMILTKRGGEA